MDTKDFAAFDVLNDMRDAVYNVAKSTGRYDMQPNVADLLMHTSGELNEAHNAYNSNNHANTADVEELKSLLERGNFDVFKRYFRASTKSTFEDEIADILLMVLSMAGYYNVDVATHVKLKCAYNALRTEHSPVSKYDGITPKSS